jgi:hypothetical protein
MLVSLFGLLLSSVGEWGQSDVDDDDVQLDFDLLAVACPHLSVSHTSDW